MFGLRAAAGIAGSVSDVSCRSSDASPVAGQESTRRRKNRSDLQAVGTGVLLHTPCLCDNRSCYLWFAAGSGSSASHMSGTRSPVSSTNTARACRIQGKGKRFAVRRIRLQNRIEIPADLCISSAGARYAHQLCVPESVHAHTRCSLSHTEKMFQNYLCAAFPPPWRKRRA